MRSSLSALLLVAPVLAQDTLSKGDVARIVDEYMAARAATEFDPWERLSLYGDLRLRQEESFELQGKPARHRSRLRLRLGATWAAADNLEVGARLSTGSRTDPRSPYATLGDGFAGLELSLDRAYATWRPETAPGLSVTAGKFSNPMRRNPVYGELVWDADVQPEGLSIGYQAADLGPLDRVDLSLGQYILVEQQLEKDTWATFVSAAARRSLARDVDLGLSANYTFVNDPVPGGSALLLADNRGNTLVGGQFAEDFGILDLIGDVTLEGDRGPLIFSAEWIDNLRAENLNAGWATGVAWGRAKDAGDWRVYYQFQNIETDAVFSPLSQDDFLRGTGHRSHLFGVNRQLTDGTGLHLWTLISAPEAGGRDEWRVRLDLTIKF
jgi:Putative porin